MNKLEQIKAREQAATPGPWEVSRETIGPLDDEIITYTIWSARDKRGSRWAVADSGNPQIAEFISAARADIPLLLAVAEAAAAFFRDDYLDLCSEAGGTTESLEELRAAIAPLFEEVTE